MVSALLKSISAQLKNHSATLYKTNILAEKPWALIDEEFEVQKLIFKRNNELVLSRCNTPLLLDQKVVLLS
jgi:hypothetical protein